MRDRVVGGDLAYHASHGVAALLDAPLAPGAPADAITHLLARRSRAELYDYLAQMKGLLQRNPTQARQILVDNPQLAKALFQMQVRFRTGGGAVTSLWHPAWRAYDHVPPAPPKPTSPHTHRLARPPPPCRSFWAWCPTRWAMWLPRALRRQTLCPATSHHTGRAHRGRRPWAVQMA